MGMSLLLEVSDKVPSAAFWWGLNVPLAVAGFSVVRVYRPAVWALVPLGLTWFGLLAQVIWSDDPVTTAAMVDELGAGRLVADTVACALPALFAIAPVVIPARRGANDGRAAFPVTLRGVATERELPTVDRADASTP